MAKKISSPRYLVESDDTKDKFYEVYLAKLVNGKRANVCNCMDYVFRKRDCKHIKRARLCWLLGY